MLKDECTQELRNRLGTEPVGDNGYERNLPIGGTPCDNDQDSE